MTNEQGEKVLEKYQLEANEVTTATIHTISTGNEKDGDKRDQVKGAATAKINLAEERKP